MIKPHNASPAVKSALMAAVLCLASGCATDPLKRITSSMDHIASAQAEYGTMGISSPVLALPSENFAFNLPKGADEFFKDAQTSRQGRVAEFQQSILSAGLGANVSFNPASGAAFVAQLQQYQQAVANN